MRDRDIFILLLIMLLVGLIFYSKSACGQNSKGIQKIEDKIPNVVSAGKLSLESIYDRHEKIFNGEILAILEKEKSLEKELDKEFIILKNQLNKSRFNIHEVESLTQYVYALERAYYQNLMTIKERLKNGPPVVSSGFIGRGPIFEQTVVRK